MSIQRNKYTRVAAFFDLDGTLIPKPSLECRLFQELLRHRRIPLGNYLRWAAQALRLLPNGLLAVRHGNKVHLTGLNRDLILCYAETVSFFEEAISRVLWHASQGHEIVLLTGTLQELAQLAASALECELEIRDASVPVRIYATRLRTQAGQWTGYLDGEALYGPAKAHLVEALGQFERIDLQQSYGYGDDFEDHHFLHLVAHSNAVNPDSELAAVANRNHWPIFRWNHRKTTLSERNLYCQSGIQTMENRV